MQEINTVYIEKDLSRFKTIIGNRNVDEERVKRIISSIKEVGFIKAPIICNENMEVIDGQGRLEACKRLKLPVPFIKIEGLTIKECRAMNIYQTNWSTRDYIESIAKSGNENYERLLDFVETSGFKLQVALTIAVPSYSNRAGELRSGRISFTEEDHRKAVQKAGFVHRFDDLQTNRRLQLVMALLFCYESDQIDNEKLIKRVMSSPKSFLTIATTMDCIDTLENVYNRFSRKEHVFLVSEYKKWLFSKGVQGLKKISLDE